MKKDNFSKSEYYCKCGKYLAHRIGNKYKTPRGVQVIIENERIIVVCKCGEKTVIK